jgi:hypothetical protein
MPESAGRNLISIPTQSAIFVGFVAGVLSVFSYTPPVPTPRRLDIIFDLGLK